MANDSSRQADEIQERWDNLYRTTPPESVPWDENKPNDELAALISSDQIEKGPVLDICSGSGNNAIYLAKQGYTCYGIDISPTAVKYAWKRAAREGVTCQLSQGNASQLPYPDSYFTLVFDRGCFHSISRENRDSFIRGVHRVLKDRGKYLLLCFSSKDHFDTGIPHSFSPEDIRNYFSPLFQILSLKEIVSSGKGTRRILLSVLMEKIVT